MIIEHRTYTFHPGKIPEFLSYYLPEALALQRRILGNLLGYFSVEVGPLNQFVHLWGYESFEDRARHAADPAPGIKNTAADRILASTVRRVHIFHLHRRWIQRSEPWT